MFSKLTGKAPLTPNEQEFFYRLKRALPEYHVQTQVAMSALMEPPAHLRGRAFWRARARFSQKIVDFVIYDVKFKVVALVELDDRTHNKYKDAKRDDMTEGAGYVTLRYESRAKPSQSEIRADVTRLASQAWLPLHTPFGDEIGEREPSHQENSPNRRHRQSPVGDESRRSEAPPPTQATPRRKRSTVIGAVIGAPLGALLGVVAASLLVNTCSTTSVPRTDAPSATQLSVARQVPQAERSKTPQPVAKGSHVQGTVAPPSTSRVSASYIEVAYLKPRGYVLANKSDGCLQQAGLLYAAGKVPAGTKLSAEDELRQTAIFEEGVQIGCYVIPPVEPPLNPYVKQLFSMKRATLGSEGACAPYGGWADDIYNDLAMPANEKGTSLDALFARAKQDGCLQ